MSAPDGLHSSERSPPPMPSGPRLLGTTSRELGLRVASAVTLAAAALALTWAGPWPFAGLIALVGAVVVWEWGTVLRKAGLDGAFCTGAGGLGLAALLAGAGHPLQGLAVIVAAAGASALLETQHKRGAAALGVLYAGVPSVALIWLRSSGSHGLEAVLFVLLAVWATDTGAFITGRSLGGPKLLPKVSPKKTWSGLAGGVAAAATISWLCATASGSQTPARVVAIGACLAVVSQIGDFLESAIKRSHGVKDASRLIPGHGGFMDRVDGLVLAAVVAALLGLMLDARAPGAALLGVPAPVGTLVR